MSVVFIACSKTKCRVPCRAQDMYQGTLFKKSLEYAKRQHQNIYILSAKYGILELDEIIEPYDLTLNSFSKAEQEAWIKKVKSQLTDKKIKPPYVFLTGEKYCQGLSGERPLSGLSFGQRLRWFDGQSRKRRRGLQI